ncbi:UNVERIFIED_CONTAM: hypothetical protein Sindi_1836300 [Sesamum indicum]
MKLLSDLRWNLYKTELGDGNPLRLATFWGSNHIFIMFKSSPCRLGLVYGRLKPPQMDFTSSNSRQLHIWKKQLKEGRGCFKGNQLNSKSGNQEMVLRKLKHTQVPVWIRLTHLPVELWTVEGLSMVASGIGRSLYSDAIMRACTRLDLARVCVMLDVSSTLPKHIIIMMPNEDGGETPCKINVEYEWQPPKCTSCMMLGHTAKMCAFTKPSNPAKSPVFVYVPKTVPARRPLMQPTQRMDKQREGRELPRGESRIPKMETARPPREANSRDGQPAKGKRA